MKKGNWKFFGLAVLIALGSFGCEYAKEERPVVTTPTPGQVLPTEGEGEPEEKPAPYCFVSTSHSQVTLGSTFNILFITNNATKGSVVYKDQIFDMSGGTTFTATANETGSFNIQGNASNEEGATVGCVASITVVKPEEVPPPPPQDTTAPTVTTTVPANAAAGVATNTVISTTFSEEVDPSSVNITVNNGVTGSVNTTGEVAVFTPSAALTKNTSYTVTVSAKDKAGNPMASPHTFSFTTETGPKLVFPIVGIVKILETCPGKPEDNFVVDKVRFVIYTAKRKDAQTNKGIQIQPIGGDHPKEKMVVITSEVANQTNVLEQGKIDQPAKIDVPDDADLKSNDLKRLEISLADTGDKWFIGGFYAQALKKGCEDKEGNWVTVHFNPFVRAWISYDKPLRLSENDAVGVFCGKIGNKGDADTDDWLDIATPLEFLHKKDPPELEYGDTDDWETHGATYCHGRTYFALDQARDIGESEKRLEGKFSELNETNINPTGGGFRLILSADEDDPWTTDLLEGVSIVGALWDWLGSDNLDGVYFENFKAYLVQPKFRDHDPNHFYGYIATKGDFWMDGEGTTDKQLDDPLPMTPQWRHDFGVGDPNPYSDDALGFLNWAEDRDDPGQN